MCDWCSASAVGVVRERGYHVHEAIWEASQRENSVCADPFIVAAAFCGKQERC